MGDLGPFSFIRRSSVLVVFLGFIGGGAPRRTPPFFVVVRFVRRGRGINHLLLRRSWARPTKHRTAATARKRGEPRGFNRLLLRHPVGVPRIEPRGSTRC